MLVLKISDIKIKLSNYYFKIKEIDANWSERLPGQHSVNTNHQLNLFILFPTHFLSPNFNYVLSMKFQVGYKPVCFYIATIYSMILYFDTYRILFSNKESLKNLLK